MQFCTVFGSYKDAVRSDAAVERATLLIRIQDPWVQISARRPSSLSEPSRFYLVAAG